MNKNTINQEAVNDRRKWIRRALIGLPVGALTVSSLQNIKEVYAANELILGSVTVSPASDTGVNLPAGCEFTIAGNSNSTLGMFHCSNIDTNGIAIYGWASGSNGVGMYAVGGSGTNGIGLIASGTTAIQAAGPIGVGLANPARDIHLQGHNACFRMDRDVNSAAFILVRTASGDYNTIWKTFYVGVDASGINNGEFFIGDVGNQVTGVSTKRLRIYNNGNVWVKTLLTGDIKMANDFTVTEDENLGVAFKNDKGEKIAVIDREGNLHIKGDVIKDL